MGARWTYQQRRAFNVGGAVNAICCATLRKVGALLIRPRGTLGFVFGTGHSSGLCMCGCGRKTKIVTKSDRRHGHVMGQRFRFIHGHSRPAAKGPNRFKLRRRTAVILLERRDGRPPLPVKFGSTSGVVYTR